MARSIWDVLFIFSLTAINRYVDCGNAVQFCTQKKSKQTERELNTALFLLRCFQNNIRVDDLDYMDVGFVFDILVESGNDSYEYDIKPTQEDFDRF